LKASLLLRTTAVYACVAMGIAGSVTACAGPRADSATPGMSPTPTVPAASPAPASDSSGLSTAGLGAVCPLLDTGVGVQVTFTVGLTDTTAQCAAAGGQLSAIVGGNWQESTQEDFSMPLACAVIHDGNPVIVRDPDGDSHGTQDCRKLIAAGWAEDRSTEQLLHNIVLSTAS
jgi:hypothetical protein